MDTSTNATAVVALKLQIQELKDLLGSFKLKGKGRAGASTSHDLEFACELQMEEYKRRLRALTHRHGSSSQPESKNKISQSAKTRALPVSPRLRDEERSSLQGKFSTRRLTSLLAQTTGEGSSSPVSRRKHKSKKTVKPQTVVCVSCMEPQLKRDVVRAPCSHRYCRGCITKMFDNSISDLLLFPARCCGQQIPILLAERLLDASLIQRLKMKEEEFRTPNPTYCASTTCALFIPPEFINSETAICPSCSKQTCLSCKKLAHAGVPDCPRDRELQATLKTAKKARWTRCYKCRAIVARESGCKHMT
jgi:hypothetical protein